MVALSYPTLYTERPITADEFAAMPAHERYELVRGRLIPVAPASTDHGALGFRLTRLIGNHVYDNNLGECYIAETGFNLTRPGERGSTVLGADLAFIRTDRVPAPGKRPAFKKVAPDFVYEIASADQSRREMSDKARLWTGRGVRLCWVHWPEYGTIDVWHPGDDEPITLGLSDELDSEDVLPGFHCPVAVVFR